MVKGEREIRRFLKKFPGARVEGGGRGGYVVVRSDGARFNVGGLASGLNDRHKLVGFLRDAA